MVVALEQGEDVFIVAVSGKEGLEFLTRWLVNDWENGTGFDDLLDLSEHPCNIFMDF
jgi:hypothetical protein